MQRPTAAGKARTVGIRLDYETKSSTDIKAGSYKYTEDPDFDLLICAYSPIRKHVGGARSLGTPRILDLRDQDAVERFRKLLLNPHFEKHAFNANFERIVSSKWMGMPNGEYIDPAGWYCTAVLANTAGVFGTLDEVARALRTKIAKDSKGKALIKFFSRPMTPRDQKAADKTCGCQVFHTIRTHPIEFADYQKYCKQDVVTEAAVALGLPQLPVEQQVEYEMDQRINDRGFRHFKALAEAAVKGAEIDKIRVMTKLKRMTGLDNPNSGKQFNGWLVDQGYPMVSLDKAHRADALADPFVPDEVRKALILKGKASLTSITKHKAALATRCADGRIRGSLRFYGAHTGREAGRGIQPQNLPVAEATLEDFRLLLSGQAGRRAPEIAKGTVRGSIVPARGHLFVTLDYNAIEARCLGWEAQEQWVMDEFNPAKGGLGKIYEATASNMFGVDKTDLIGAIDLCRKCGNCEPCRLRGRGKVSNLALGYNGGAGALVTMGAEKEGIDVGNYNELHAEWTALGKPGKFWEWERDRHDYPELIRLRDLYRDKSPRTVRFWKQCATAWDIAASGKVAHFGPEGRIAMMRDGKHNRLVLPSGRSIWYRFAASHRDQNNPDRVDRRTFIGKSMGVGHHRTDTHGGKLCVSGNAPVLTDRGWIKLQDVAADDKVWDGVNYVAHGGLIRKGVKPVIDIEGVRMTPDHEIMQEGGWREAQQYDRSDWSDVGLPIGAWLFPLGTERGQTAPGVAGVVPVRDGVYDAPRRGSSWATASTSPPEILRLHEGRVGISDHLADGGWAQQAPALQSVAYGEVPLHETDSPSVGELRGSWDQDAGAVAQRLLDVRSGHDPDVEAGAGTGPDRQRRALRAEQLPVGYAQGAGEQQKEEVFDLMDCGPLKRFTILTDNGPLLVHNCENITQAVARDILFDLMLRIEAAKMPGRLVLHVHDEVVLEVPDRHADQVLADTKGLMEKTPDWAPGLLLAGAGGVMERYRK